MNRRRRERGAAAVEFALLSPVLLLLVAGCINFGLAGYAKFRLSDAAMVAVRSCVAAGAGTCAGNATNLARTRWPGASQVCNGNLQTTVLNQGNVITVSASCAFQGGVMQAYMGMSNLSIRTSAAMPF